MERTSLVRLRLSPVERAVIEQGAKRAGLTLSEYIRRKVCGKLPDSLRGPGPRNQRPTPEDGHEAKRKTAAEKARAVLAGM